jgi:hypothetical protein
MIINRIPVSTHQKVNPIIIKYVPSTLINALIMRIINMLFMILISSYFMWVA